MSLYDKKNTNSNSPKQALAEAVGRLYVNNLLSKESKRELIQTLTRVLEENETIQQRAFI